MHMCSELRGQAAPDETQLLHIFIKLRSINCPEQRWQLNVIKTVNVSECSESDFNVSYVAVPQTMFHLKVAAIPVSINISFAD